MSHCVASMATKEAIEDQYQVSLNSDAFWGGFLGWNLVLKSIVRKTSHTAEQVPSPLWNRLSRCESIDRTLSPVIWSQCWRRPALSSGRWQASAWRSMTEAHLEMDDGGRLPVISVCHAADGGRGGGWRRVCPSRFPPPFLQASRSSGRNKKASVAAFLPLLRRIQAKQRKSVEVKTLLRKKSSSSTGRSYKIHHCAIRHSAGKGRKSYVVSRPQLEFQTNGNVKYLHVNTKEKASIC